PPTHRTTLFPYTTLFRSKRPEKRKSGSELPHSIRSYLRRQVCHRVKESRGKLSGGVRFRKRLICENGMRRELERELDSGESAASAGFLPGEIDAVDNGERRNDGNHPEDRPHEIEEATDDDQYSVCGALNK